MSERPSLKALLPEGPFAFIKRAGEEDILFLKGPIHSLDKLEHIPRKSGKPSQSQEAFDTLSILPFRQVEELGFKARSEGEKILCMEVTEQKSFSEKELLSLLPQEHISLSGEGHYSPDDAAYAKQIKAVIEDEIGMGEGCNFVVPRRFSAKIADFTHAKALSIFRNLLTNEYGVYWTYLYFTGDRYFIGATPERHISCKKKQVKMNPISGTFRKFEHSEKNAMGALQAFISDQKEIFELLMVTDEELKMMAGLCGEGGQVIGPLLKEMSKLIHSEYLLVGKSNRCIIEMLKESMFATTVVGSPIENACRIVHKYDPISRGYYGSALALIGRDSDGEDTLDSPITIRTADIKTDGSFVVTVGATLVRDSLPEDEVKETHAKAEGILCAIGCSSPKGADYKPVSKPYRIGTNLLSEEIQIAISQRNQRLSRFWIEKQEAGYYVNQGLAGKKVLIIDNEDSFTKMIGHMLSALGMLPRIVRYDSYEMDSKNADLFVLGPGPGNPSNLSDPKISKVRHICRSLLKEKKPLLGVCLGHQVLCSELGLSVEKKAVTFQGKQDLINLWGQKEWVGFYNAFVGKFSAEKEKEIEFSYDHKTGDIHALRGRGFASVQFHPESILTNNGIDILECIVSSLLTP